MTKVQLRKFWRRNGFGFLEAAILAEKEISKKVIVGLKKLRIENKKRKENQV
jgi:hypothetical protein